MTKISGAQTELRHDLQQLRQSVLPGGRKLVVYQRATAVRSL